MESESLTTWPPAPTIALPAYKPLSLLTDSTESDQHAGSTTASALFYTILAANHLWLWNFRGHEWLMRHLRRHHLPSPYWLVDNLALIAGLAMMIAVFACLKLTAPVAGAAFGKDARILGSCGTVGLLIGYWIVPLFMTHIHWFRS